MRFLVDRCAGVTFAKWLRDRGHDVDDASECPQDPGDAAVLRKATDDDRILVTIDTDFGLLIFADERPRRALVRLPDCPAAGRIAVFSDLLARHKADLEARAVITVSAGRVRISRPQKSGDWRRCREKNVARAGREKRAPSRALRAHPEADRSDRDAAE